MADFFRVFNGPTELPRASGLCIHTVSLGLSGTVSKPCSHRNQDQFLHVGYCRFTDCPVRAHVEVTDECTLKATVVFSGGGQYACQFTAELLQTKLPRSLYLESMHKLSQMVISRVSIQSCKFNMRKIGIIA